MNPACTVDLIVPNNGGIVFVKRKNHPFKGCWALPGGFLETGRETLEQAAIRELSEETHLSVHERDLELLGVYSNPDRDPRGHVVSHVYVVKRYSGFPRADDDAAELAVFQILPERLAFDHRRILEEYFRRYGHGKN